MKLRAIKRCVRRASKQENRGTYKGRLARATEQMNGAIFATFLEDTLQPNGKDIRWCFRGREGKAIAFAEGHNHWYGTKCPVAVSVAYVK